MKSSFRPILYIGLTIAAVGAIWVLSPEPVKLQGWHHDVDAAVQYSQQEDKPVFVMVTADWCGPCQYMKKEILSDPQVDQLLREKYSLLVLDASGPDSPGTSMAMSLGTEAFPTFYVTRPGSMTVDRELVGGLSKDEFISWIRQQSAMH